MGYRQCAECGGEYQAWVARCLDCDAPLGALVPIDGPPPDREHDDAVARRTTSLAIDALPPRSRERLRMLLRGADVRFEMDQEHVWFPEERLPAVDAILRDIRDRDGSGDAAPEHGQRQREPGLPADRALVGPALRDQHDRPLEHVGAWPRALAKIVDSLIATALIGVSTLAVAAPWLGWLGFLAILAALESRYGRTPGKVVVGVHVQDLDGNPPRLLAATVRNAWQLVGLVPLVVPTLVAPVLEIAMSGSIGWLIARDPLCRGPHDRVAGTVVVRTRQPIRRRLVVSQRAIRAEET